MEGRGQGIKVYSDERAYKENTDYYSDYTINYNQQIYTDIFFP